MYGTYLAHAQLLIYLPTTIVINKFQENMRIDYLDPLVEQALNSCSERKGATETPFLEAKVLHVQKKHHFHEAV